jgi:hypothetical protein
MTFSRREGWCSRQHGESHAIPFLKRDGERSALNSALGTLGIGVGRELLNFYRGMVQKRHESWPGFNLLMSSIHSLIDQEHSGDINIVPNFRWHNPAKLLSQLSEKDLIELMVGGERSAYPAVEAIRTCTKISRTMEEILLRFEQGDLRPDESEYHRPRSSRRRPPPTFANGEALREHRRHSDRVPDRRNRNSPRRAARLERKANRRRPTRRYRGLAEACNRWPSLGLALCCSERMPRAPVPIASPPGRGLGSLGLHSRIDEEPPMTIARRIFVSSPRDEYLDDRRNELKWAIVKEIERLGYEAQVFGSAEGGRGLASGRSWSPNAADEVMQRCVASLGSRFGIACEARRARVFRW